MSSIRGCLGTRRLSIGRVRVWGGLDLCRFRFVCWERNYPFERVYPVVQDGGMLGLGRTKGIIKLDIIKNLKTSVVECKHPHLHSWHLHTPPTP